MISKIFTAAVKELILLKRDRTGLLVLFLMPAILVIIITLVQENVMELTGQKKTQLLLLDLDGGELGKALRLQLAAERIEVIDWDKQQKNSDDLKAAVTGGEYRLGIIIPQGGSDTMQQGIALHTVANTSSQRSIVSSQVVVPVFFDPGILPGLRSGLTAQLEMALATIAMDAKLQNLDRELQGLLDTLGVAKERVPLHFDSLTELLDRPLLVLKDSHTDAVHKETLSYNPVQQNVPAWALFGMFFTAIPIAGAILQERKSGLWIRLSSLPVSHLVFFAGKVVAYIGVCLSQFLLIGLIGTLLFPHLGLPVFALSGSAAPVLSTVLLSSLAACGFGILLGISCTTYEQASTLGSTAVVAAAAIGGVMVPVYAMPEAMQRLSIISPLNWGLTAFQDLLVRGYSFSAIWDDLGRLVLFFLLTIFLAWRLAQPQR